VVEIPDFPSLLSELRKALAEELGREACVYGYFKQAGVDWNGKSISAGDTTDELPTLGYSQKTFYFLSNVSGVLTIQVKEPDGDWRTYDTPNVTAGVLLPCIMTAQAISVRLSFNQSATVTAWYVMKVV
jgi:hypothetical protein